MNEKDFKVEKMDFKDLERFLNNYHKNFRIIIYTKFFPNIAMTERLRL